MRTAIMLVGLLITGSIVGIDADVCNMAFGLTFGFWMSFCVVWDIKDFIKTL